MKRKSLIIPVMLTCVMLLNGCGAKSIDDIYSMASTEATTAEYVEKEPKWHDYMLYEKLPDGKFRPVKLISAGLTNNPNIPDSGRIVKSREDAATKARSSAKIKEIKKAAAAAHAAAARSEKCAASAKELKNLSRAAVVEMRMRLAKASRPNSPAPQDSRPRKISPRELAELASKRSAELGEPYLKSFSAIRKQYVFTTPKQKE